MSAPLVISISHSLGKEEALRRIKPALGKAASSFPVLNVEEETWSGDRMDFRVRRAGPGRCRQRAGGGGPTCASK